MGKGKSSKKNLKKEAKILKSLETDQQLSPAPGKNSVKLLKNIQTQLDEIVSQREIASKKIKKLGKRTKVIGQQINSSEAHLSKLALNKDLQRIKASLEKKNKQFEKETTQLNKEILQFKSLTQRVEKKIRNLEEKSAPSATQLQSLTHNNVRLLKKISNFEEELNQFFDTYIHPDEAISEFSTQLNNLNKVIKQMSNDYQKHDTQIKQLQTDTSKLTKSIKKETHNHSEDNLKFKKELENHQQDIESHQRDIKSHQQYIENHQKDIESQQQLIAPLETHLQELENNIQALQLEYTQHQQISSDDNNDFSELKVQQQELSEKLSEFNNQLSQSQDTLKQHIEQLQESTQQENLSERNPFNEVLEKLSLQLSDVTEQSNKHQDLFNTFQDEKKTDNEHHDELSKQYLLQQQQLDQYEGQLQQLPTLITLSESSTKHIEQITGSLEQLSDTQNNLSQLENDLQSNLQTLDQKIDDNHSQHQKNIDKLLHYQQNLESKAIQGEGHQREIESHQRDIESHQQGIDSLQHEMVDLQRHVKSRRGNVEAFQQDVDNRQQIMESRQEDMKAHQLDLENHQHKLVSYQQDQSVSMNQLSDQIKKRSQLFSLGIIAVLGISALLFFTQNNETETQDLITQIKTDVTNETFSKINVLTKQNSTIINQQFNQIKDSIKQVKIQLEQAPEAINIDALKNNWQQQHTVLEKALTEATTKQEELNQTVIQLSQSIGTIGNQYQLIQKNLSLKAETALQKNKLKTNNELSEITSLNKNSPSFYTIQLLGAQQKASVISYIKEYNLSDSTRIHQTEFQNKPWYILVQGHYSSFAEAKEQLQKLPEILQKNSPWVKKLP